MAAVVAPAAVLALRVPARLRATGVRVDRAPAVPPAARVRVAGVARPATEVAAPRPPVRARTTAPPTSAVGLARADARPSAVVASHADCPGGAAPGPSPAHARAADEATPEALANTELARAVESLDVDGEVWQGAGPDEAAHAAWFLQRVAHLTGDVTAHDLAALWTIRADGSEPARPRDDEGVTRVHRELDAYCRTGLDVHLRRAQAVATRLATAPVWSVDVRRGRWASVLASLECRRPADAVLPGTPAP